MRVKFPNSLLLILAANGAVLLSGCQSARKEQASAMTGGDPNRGAESILSYGCGACHNIPGITGAHGLVGPPMDGIRSRLFIAGNLPNQPSNLIQWVKDPKSIKERTAMPTLGVTSADALDIAAYLYSLR